MKNSHLSLINRIIMYLGQKLTVSLTFFWTRLCKGLKITKKKLPSYKNRYFFTHILYLYRMQSAKWLRRWKFIYFDLIPPPKSLGAKWDEIYRVSSRPAIMHILATALLDELQSFTIKLLREKLKSEKLRKEK